MGLKCKKIGVSFVASRVICYFCSIELQKQTEKYDDGKRKATAVVCNAAIA